MIIFKELVTIIPTFSQTFGSEYVMKQIYVYDLIKWVLFDDFQSMLLQDLPFFQSSGFLLI